MPKISSKHATVVASGTVYIPPRFLEDVGLPSNMPVIFHGAEDALSFIIIPKQGKTNMSAGNFRIGIDAGNKLIRTLEKNKPSGYPYAYKGVYQLHLNEEGHIVGTLVAGKVSSIHS